MKNLTITVFIPHSDFTYFLEVFSIVKTLPNLECNYTFRGKDIRFYTEKMMGESQYMLNMEVSDFLKWQIYHNKNK